MILEWIAIVALLILISVFILLTTPSTGQKLGNNQTVSMGVTPLFGREKEIDRLARQILTGQSSALVSMFGKDRTNILGYLSDPNKSQILYGERADKLVFNLLDVSILSKECDSPQFWERALRPLGEKFEPNSSLFQIYQTCKQDNFNEYVLDKLIVQMRQEGWQLILMLDRFDELLFYPNFKENREFFATLRRLASSRSPSSLSLIISWNLSLKDFHKVTKDLDPKGSPYFNFISEIVLKALSDAEADELLRKDFSDTERQFLKELTGKHPYLLQLAVSALQTAKENKEQAPLEIALQTFSEGVENLLSNLIYAWDAKVCKAIVALVKEGQTPVLVNDEFALLEKQGLVMKDSNNQWQVSPRVLVDFINKKTEQELCNRMNHYI